MYFRIVTIPLQAGKAEEYARIMEQVAGAAATSAQGYQGGNVLVDRQRNIGGTVTFWETREQAETFGSSAGRERVMAALRAIVAGDDHTEIYEVTHHVPVG